MCQNRYTLLNPIHHKEFHDGQRHITETPKKCLHVCMDCPGRAYRPLGGSPTPSLSRSTSGRCHCWLDGKAYRGRMDRVFFCIQTNNRPTHGYHTCHHHRQGERGSQRKSKDLDIFGVPGMIRPGFDPWPEWGGSNQPCTQLRRNRFLARVCHGTRPS